MSIACMFFVRGYVLGGPTQCCGLVLGRARGILSHVLVGVWCGWHGAGRRWCVVRLFSGNPSLSAFVQRLEVSRDRVFPVPAVVFSGLWGMCVASLLVGNAQAVVRVDGVGWRLLPARAGDCVKWQAQLWCVLEPVMQRRWALLLQGCVVSWSIGALVVQNGSVVELKLRGSGVSAASFPCGGHCASRPPVCQLLAKFSAVRMSDSFM